MVQIFKASTGRIFVRLGIGNLGVRNEKDRSFFIDNS